MENVSQKPIYSTPLKNPFRPTSLHFIIGMVLSFLCYSQASGQNLSFNNQVPTEMVVCESNETFLVEFTNISGGVLSNPKILLDFPFGVEYVSGSISETSFFDVTELPYFNPSAITFSMDNLPSGGTVSFTVEAQANYNAYLGYMSGSVFSNEVTVSYIGNSENGGTSSYDILYYPSSLQTRNVSIINPTEDCDIVAVELEMMGTELGSVKDILINIGQPLSQSMTIEPGSAEVLYPEGGSYTTIADPILVGSTYTITAADMGGDLATKGLSGTADPSSNLLKLRFNVLLDNTYQMGETFLFEISGSHPCGDPLPNTELTYDPNSSFDPLVGTGLEDINDSWGVAWGDYDNDGNVDLFVTTYDVTTPNVLYRNNGNGTFTKVNSGSITTDNASSLSASWGDYDNNGTLDLFIANNIGYENFLYRNNGDGSFTRIFDDPIVDDIGYAHGASWVDYDNDGFLDMFVADYFSTKFNKLYHNNGDGTFSVANSAAVATEASFSSNGVWGDFNNDGYPDLFVANTLGNNNSLYKNTGNGNFERIISGSIVNDGGNSVGASWGDYDNDGDLDLFVSNSGDQNNFLYRNNGDETFTKMTSGNIVNDGGHSHGSAWADYDNDGDLDLYVSNDQGQDNFLYSNNGDGTFTSVSNSVSLIKGESFGAAWADYDNDGDVDLFVTNHNSEQNFIYENDRGNCQNKIVIELEGTHSNRSAMGSKIFVKANIYGEEVWQMRELSGQSGGGIGGQNELKTIFGLGDATEADSIIVEWPSGYRQILKGPFSLADYAIKEGNGSEICGVVYYDENGNCVQDANETGIQGINLSIQPGNIKVITDDNGEYSTTLSPGNYTIEQSDIGGNWDPVCTALNTLTVIGFDNIFCGINFGNDADCSKPDLQVEVSVTPHRVGFQNLIALTYRNVGAQTATEVELELKMDDEIIALESSLPWLSYDGDEVKWELGDVPIGASATIFIVDSVSIETDIGKKLDVEGKIDAKEGDCEKKDNKSKDEQLAVGAVDPNDILVNPIGYIDNDQELIYKIRFQNVGNASVSTVRIEDRLPAELDLNTLQIGVASHSYRFEIQDGNRLIWTFENINMPDSIANEPESHGYVTFKILPKGGLEKGTTIENTALIFFDNFAAIETNTVINIIGQAFGAVVVAGQLQIVPNPLVDQSTIRIISLDGANIKIQALFLYDILGREVFGKIGNQTERFELERDFLREGHYFIRAIGIDGKQYSGKIIIGRLD